MRSLRPPRRRARGSTVIVTLTTLTALSLMAAYAITRVMPRLRMAYQNAAWQEARLGAEAGIDSTMADLLANATGPAEGAWQGWKKKNPLGLLIPVGQGGFLGNTLSATLYTVNDILGTLLGGGGGGATVTGPIVMDNVRVSATSGVPTEIDVQLWAIQPLAAPQIYWFRIRAMATCALPPTAFDPPANLDGPLRRFSLRTVRPKLKANDVGAPSSIPLPNVSRTVEVLVEPILPFELAIWTKRSLELGALGAWCVDSYDSRDPEKSDGNAGYPGVASPKVQENGHVACNQGRPASSLYGPLISVNGARVRGHVATNGGDNPATPEHENVDGAMSVEPARIRDDFCREMGPTTRPPGLALPAPILGLPFLAGTESSPAKYLVPGNLDSFQVIPPGGGARGLLILLVNGNFNLTTPLTIPPTVTVQIYVRGQVHLWAAANTTALSSFRPSKLQIFGEYTPGATSTLTAHGAISVCALFYGPSYGVTLDGGVNWTGSVVADTFGVNGGGAGGVHYDESLATLGPPIGYRIARYVEDVRE